MDKGEMERGGSWGGGGGEEEREGGRGAGRGWTRWGVAVGGLGREKGRHGTHQTLFIDCNDGRLF